MSTGERTRELLTNHTWYCNKGYAMTHNERKNASMHRLLMHIDNSPLFVDHINRCSHQLDLFSDDNKCHVFLRNGKTNPA
jgi:hypothetical protein